MTPTKVLYLRPATRSSALPGVYGYTSEGFFNFEPTEIMRRVFGGPGNGNYDACLYCWLPMQDVSEWIDVVW